jgi:gluconate 5-dehydrogenase
VSKQDEVKALFRKVDRDFGRLDILFNNAGIATKGTRIHEMLLEDWNRVIDVNLNGTFMCMQEGLKLMLRQKSGSIINISSILGLSAIDPEILAIAHYIASKHAIGGTRLGDVEKRGDSGSYSDKVTSLTPLRRFGEPEELKGLAVLLASDASTFITGATFVPDGGWSAW